jgi:hypothetical protein
MFDRKRTDGCNMNQCLTLKFDIIGKENFKHMSQLKDGTDFVLSVN